jgi:hypothetical protein
MGLGLSICYSIIREHGGQIFAVNMDPRGAAVVIELPGETSEGLLEPPPGVEAHQQNPMLTAEPTRAT